MALCMGNHYFHILHEKRIRKIYCNVGFVNGLLYLRQENNIRSSRQTAYRSYSSGAEKKPPLFLTHARLLRLTASTDLEAIFFSGSNYHNCGHSEGGNG